MKYFKCLIIIILILISTSCSKKESKDMSKIEIPITNDMEYLSEETKEVEDQIHSARDYVIKNKTLEEVMLELEQLYNNDGWTTTYKVEPTFLQLIKDKTQVTILLFEQDDEILVKVIILPIAEK